MQTVTSMSERLDMSAEEAVEKLLYMDFDVKGVDDNISDEMCDLLIDIDDDPKVADEVRDHKLKEKEKAEQERVDAAEKERQAALLPDKEKIEGFCQYLEDGITYPETNSAEARQLIEQARLEIELVAAELWKKNTAM